MLDGDAESELGTSSHSNEVLRDFCFCLVCFFVFCSFFNQGVPRLTLYPLCLVSDVPLHCLALGPLGCFLCSTVALPN